MPKLSFPVRYLLIGALLLGLGGVVGYKIGQQGNSSLTREDNILFRLTNLDQPPEFKEVDFSQFWEVWRTLEATYVDPSKIKTDQMVYGAIKGMTSSLGDPYTVFLPPVEQKRSMEDLQGSFYGIGIQLGYIDNTLAVSTPLKGSPAEKAGIKAKDLILHVKDEKKGLDKDTQGWSLAEAVDYIRGDKGAPVILTIFRKDDPEKAQPFQVTVARDEIIVPSAELQYVEKDGKKYAHIILSRFGDRTMSELSTAIQDIQSQNPKVAGVVLDMRNNPGGYLEGAISVASEFVRGGVVVTQQGRTAAQTKEYQARGSARLVDYPLVVVVNGGSASASEIVAGALRDRRDIKMVGEKTFGKGTVQDALQLDKGAGLHVTIARWMLPDGDWIHEQGIPVAVEVKDDPNTPEDEVIMRAVQEVKK